MRLCAGKVKLVSRRCSLLVDVLMPSVAMLGRSGTCGPTLELATSEPLWVECDSLRLKQASVRACVAMWL